VSSGQAALVAAEARRRSRAGREAVACLSAAARCRRVAPRAGHDARRMTDFTRTAGLMIARLGRHD
jgi:hypothetical protein